MAHGHDVLAHPANSAGSFRMAQTPVTDPPVRVTRAPDRLVAARVCCGSLGLQQGPRQTLVARGDLTARPTDPCDRCWRGLSIGLFQSKGFKGSTLKRIEVRFPLSRKAGSIELLL